MPFFSIHAVSQTPAPLKAISGSLSHIGLAGFIGINGQMHTAAVTAAKSAAAFREPLLPVNLSD